MKHCSVFPHWNEFFIAMVFCRLSYFGRICPYFWSAVGPQWKPISLILCVKCPAIPIMGSNPGSETLIPKQKLPKKSTKSPKIDSQKRGPPSNLWALPNWMASQQSPGDEQTKNYSVFSHKNQSISTWVNQNSLNSNYSVILKRGTGPRTSLSSGHPERLWADRRARRSSKGRIRLLLPCWGQQTDQKGATKMMSPLN